MTGRLTTPNIGQMVDSKWLERLRDWEHQTLDRWWTRGDWEIDNTKHWTDGGLEVAGETERLGTPNIGQMVDSR